MSLRAMDTFPDDRSPVRIGHPSRIADVLADTSRHGHVLVIHGADGTRHNSAILHCSARPPCVLVDEPPDGWPAAEGPLTFTLCPAGVEIRFVAVLDPVRGAVGFPEELLVREQRSDFRAHVGYDDAVPVTVDGVDGRLRNLSVCGFGAWFPAVDATALKERLLAADAVACGVGFRDAVPGTLRGRVRHVEDAGPQGVRAGIQFVDPTPETVRALRRWSMELEREALRRRRAYEER